MLSTNTAVQANAKKREELESDVERFLRQGGEIQWCDSSWNMGSECDAETLRRRRFELGVQKNTFGKDDKSRLVRVDQ